ncbi:hypothetical protein B0H66DRAFT_570859 [Apodospora peruviana]|uniref:GYF domain-containing protein n=1 Tax=Apodospora peruviana TaxID=516989 RepID=A0AAE0HTF5_9PEZI|nr:hypothetical protein B0H66DRAFT_570859 [Apodospora peruviana]
MPSQLPSSFASAAAGQNRDPRGTGRSDSVRGSGSGEWPRSNGTRTFRRQSTTPFNQSVSANSNDMPQTSATDAPPMSANSQSVNFDTPGSLRYSKEELLEISKNTRELSQIDLSSLYLPNWNPTQVNGGSVRGWGKTGDSAHIPQDPTVCWDHNGLVAPIGLEEMSPEERELFAGDVNSTLKIPQQIKDGGLQGGGGPNGRKTSISAGTGNYAMSTPSSASRPGTRRRETTDTSPFPGDSLASPTANSRFSRDAPWLPTRRATELKEGISDEPEEDNSREAPTRGQSFAQSTRGGNTTTANNFGSASGSTSGSASLWGVSPVSATSGIGAFGSFALGASTIGDKRFGGTAGGSRLAHLLPKDSTESPPAKPSPSDAVNPDANRGWRPRQRTDTDPFGTEDNASGSAVLGGAQDNSPPTMPTQIQRGGMFDTPVKGSTGDFGMSGLTLGNTGLGNGPASPSETNPYRSPLADRVDDGHDDNEPNRHVHGGPGSEPSSNFNTLSRTFGANAFEGSDRSQTSSVGAKGFPTVNTMTGWPAGPSSATPDRERQFNNAFGGSIFSPLGDLPTPGLGGLGGVFGAPSASGLGRGSKLGSLFPPAMQAQMHGHEQESLGDSVPDLRQSNPLGAIGRGAIGTQSRDTGSPVRTTRGAFEDVFPSASQFTTGEQVQSGLTATTGAPFSATQTSGDPSAMRTMVMPDRMRWVYLDPQGTMQGPFSGLEMNDWYKANFFTPDLRVKRLEDPDFEPLGQLIRRIGNSREPFLVPQMGVPHGPPPQPGGPFAIGSTSEAVPPLQNAFPSFGRTLTAAQQNDLERRKQEEQLYHARQRELAHHHHHQPFGRLPIQPGLPGALHHHSSAHSLQSQPSFGSITSPIAMAPQPPIGAIGPNAGFFDASVSMAPGAPQSAAFAGAETFTSDLNFGERQLLANMQATGGLQGIMPGQPTSASGNDNSGLRSQLPGIDQLQKDSQGFSTRIKEFMDLRAQHEADEAAAVAGLSDVRDRATQRDDQFRPRASEEVVSVTKATISESPTEITVTKKVTTQSAQSQHELSLTERVRKTQADAAAAAVAVAAAVAKPVRQPASSGLPMPFPPPQESATPLAAPTAQRPASNLPSRYDERSVTGTPDTSSDGAALAPPPTAPWAPQPGTEAQKGPSLKEIQEAEAKKAAKKEEAAAALRRAALEQEAAALREREKAAAAVNVGLPATSTWGTGSPVGAPTAGSPWKQPAAVKASVGVSSANASSKKTLADIQREEEARKQKAQQAAMQSVVNAGASMGKRYADLASKGSAPPGLGNAIPLAAVAASVTQPTTGGGWSTVGAGGKVKIPTGPAAQTRISSATLVKTPVPVTQKLVQKQGPAGSKDAKGVALDEFKKWLHRELSRGLVGVDNVDHFANMLLEMPLDPLILSEAVYLHSTTMDGRHFGEEFVRRKKQADKGIVEKELSVNESKNNGNGGWNEVAKKGGSTNTPKEDTSVAGFKIVPSKKTKGKK